MYFIVAIHEIRIAVFTQRRQHHENPTTSTSNFMRKHVNSARQQRPGQLDHLGGNYFHLSFIERLNREKREVAQEREGNLGEGEEVSMKGQITLVSLNRPSVNSAQGS